MQVVPNNITEGKFKIVYIARDKVHNFLEVVAIVVYGVLPT